MCCERWLKILDVLEKEKDTAAQERDGSLFEIYWDLWRVGLLADVCFFSFCVVIFQ